VSEVVILNANICDRSVFKSIKHDKAHLHDTTSRILAYVLE
jgi:hypothetical protein